jgi:V8-like Glu-specific endopeptidase
MFNMFPPAAITASIVVGTLLGAGGTTAVQAAESCPMPMFKHPLMGIEKIDLKQLEHEEEAMFEHYKETLPDGTAKYDFRTEIEQTTTDKRDISFPLYSNGMIFDERVKKYVGSGIMISPCHMLTANHVVDLQKREEKAVIGSHVQFEFAKDPNGYHFRNKIKGTIVASSNHDKLDYAIVEFPGTSTGTQDGSLVYVPPCSPAVLKKIGESPAVSVGYPEMYENVVKPAVLYGMRVRVYDFGDVLKAQVNVSPRESGGPILTYTKNSFCVSGIKVRTNSARTPDGISRPTLNTGNVIVPLMNIFGDLVRRNKNLVDRIFAAQESGQCSIGR